MKDRQTNNMKTPAHAGGNEVVKKAVPHLRLTTQSLKTSAHDNQEKVQDKFIDS